MEPIPLVVRRRIIALYKEGNSTSEIAKIYGYCKAAVRRVYQQYRETGSIEPRVGKVGRKLKLDPVAQEQLQAKVAACPDATLAELREAIGIDASLGVWCRMLKRLGLTRKKSRCTPRSRIVPT